MSAPLLTAVDLRRREVAGNDSGPATGRRDGYVAVARANVENRGAGPDLGSRHKCVSRRREHC
jgi:hypothetical protein